jgi:hypothetical protein
MALALAQAMEILLWDNEDITPEPDTLMNLENLLCRLHFAAILKPLVERPRLISAGNPRVGVDRDIRTGVDGKPIPYNR